VTVGFDPDSFWHQTIRTIEIAMQGKNEAARIEHNKRVWMIWHLAALQRSKKMRSLKSMMMKKRPRVQSIEEQQAIMAGWSEARNKRLSDNG
jgi:hypothetical protein